MLSSTQGALGETVGDAAGLLEPSSVAQIQAQLTRAATDAEWRGQLRAAGLERAREFDWRSTAAATLRVYSRAVTQREHASAAAHRPLDRIRRAYSVSHAPSPSLSSCAVPITAVSRFERHRLRS